MKFSVIIPTYNRLDYLQEAVNSVLNQTYKNYEIIIINDYPEQSVIVEQTYKHLEELRIINHSESKGGNVARNTGLKYATGEIVAFLDDDDIWHPDKLRIHALEHQQYPDAGLIFSECMYFYDCNSKTESTNVELPDNVLEAMGRGRFCPITSSAVTVKSVCFESCGTFDNELVSFQDWDMWFRIAKHYRFIKIDRALVYFRQHSGSRTSMDINKRLFGLEQILRKWGNRINKKEFKRRNKAIAIYFYLRSLTRMGFKKKAFMLSFGLLEVSMLDLLPVTLFVKAQIHILLLSRLKLYK